MPETDQNYHYISIGMYNYVPKDAMNLFHKSVEIFAWFPKFKVNLNDCARASKLIKHNK